MFTEVASTMPSQSVHQRDNYGFMKAEISSVLPAMVMLLGASALFAQSNDDQIRVHYTREDAPRPVIFGVLLTNTFVTSLRPHDGSYADLKSGGNSQANLEDVFDYLVLLWLQQDKEYGELTVRMLRPKDGPGPSGKDIFLVFDALDDLRHALRHKYYAIAKSELIARYSFDLDDAIDSYSVGFSETWQYHEKSYGGSAKRAEEVANHICQSGHSTRVVIQEVQVD